MRVVAYVLAAVFALVGVLILAAAVAGSGVGPVELVAALVPIALAVILVNTARRGT